MDGSEASMERRRNRAGVPGEGRPECSASAMLIACIFGDESCLAFFLHHQGQLRFGDLQTQIVGRDVCNARGRTS